MDEARDKKAREQAVQTLAKLAQKHNKTHHLGRDGHQLIRNDGGEVIIGISKKGSTGLVKVTMPIDALPKEVQKFGTKAVQAHHMTWIGLDASPKIAEKAMVARITNKKTSKQFSVEVYGTEDAPCWTKAVKKATGKAKKQVKGAKKTKTKMSKQAKSASTVIRRRKGTKGKKATATA